MELFVLVMIASTITGVWLAYRQHKKRVDQLNEIQRLADSICNLADKIEKRDK